MAEIIENEDIIQLNHGNGSITPEDIKNTLEAIAENENIDLLTCKQGQYKYCCTQLGKTLFKNNALRKEVNGRLYNNGEYDIALVDKIASVYIWISQLYNKYINMAGFGYFANIPFYTLDAWENGERLSGVTAPMFKKITSGQAQSITDKLYDSNNVTGQAMLANNVLGWNTSRSTSETTHRVESISTLEADFSNLLGGENKTILISEQNSNNEQ